MSHSKIGHREKVDSRLLVVESQTVSLTPGPSFAHNSGCKCPNGSCKAILDIYTSRSFQCHKERTNARRFDPSNLLLNFQKSRRTPSLPFLGMGVAFSHFSQSGVATIFQCYFSSLKIGSLEPLHPHGFTIYFYSKFNEHHDCRFCHHAHYLSLFTNGTTKC